MHHLLRYKTIKAVLLFTAIVYSFNANAQREIHRPNHDDLPYYFGITLGYNSSSLSARKHPTFMYNDSVLTGEPGASGGITLGLTATGRLADHFEIRLNPQLIIGGAKYFTYTLGLPAAGESINQKKMLPSTLVSLPIQLKFNSDRIDNFRVYLLGGVRLNKDLSSNSTARNADDLIKLKGTDIGLEGGIGFNFFLPFVTISPELKFTYGLGNVHVRDPNLKYSSIFDRIESRMLSFSVHFE